MPPVFIPFDGWSPSPGYFGEGWNPVRNLYPAFNAWRPWRKFVGVGAGTANGPITGRHTHFGVAGVGSGSFEPDAQTIYCGSSTRLMDVNPSTGAFTDRSRGAFYGPNYGGWRFASVGNDIWATNWIDALQRCTNNTGAFADGLVSTFKPRPRFIAVVRGHLLWANDSTGRADDWGWSDQDDATNMDPPTTTSTSIAGRPAPLVSVPGQITGLVGGQYALAFKSQAVYYLEYAGPPQVFRAEELSSSIGTRYPSSIIKSRFGVFFRGPDGFYRVDGLSAPVRISPPGIDQFLMDSAFTNPVYKFVTWKDDIQMVGFQSPVWPLVGWLYRTAWNDDANTTILIYCPPLDAWSVVDVGTPSITTPIVRAASGPTMIVERPYAASNYDTLAAFTWDGTTAKYAPLDSTGVSANIVAPSMSLNFRPANKGEAVYLGQSHFKRVLPIFSKTDLSGTPLTPQVTVEPMLDPFAGVSAAGAEVMTSANRSTIDGSYPFVRAGLLGRISIQCAAEDFADFPGVWIDQELLR